jgi:hypothetical protein
MPLPEDWRAFIESLNSHGVEYVVVGAALPGVVWHTREAARLRIRSSGVRVTV